MRIAAHSSPVTYAGQESAKTPYFVEKKCLTALPLTRPSATLSQWEREHAAADEGGSASATFSRREKVPRRGG